MTRPLRVEYPGAFYHVYSRGNAGEKVFNGKRDKAIFLEYISKVTERFSVCGETGKNPGEYFGGVSGMAITLSYNSVFNKSCKDNKLKKKINKIKSKILDY